MIEQPTTEDTGSIWNGQMTKREFLRYTALAAVSLACSPLTALIPPTPATVNNLPPPSDKTKEPPVVKTRQPVSPEQLKSIEDKYQIEILAGGIEIPQLNRNDTLATIDWEKKDLNALDSALSLLPAHFYLPRVINGENIKLRFGLLDDVLSYCKCDAESEVFKQDKRLLVALGKEFLHNPSFLDNPKDLQGIEPSLFLTSHEIFHALSMTDINSYTRRIVEPLDVPEEGMLSVFSSEIRWPSYATVPSEVHGPNIVLSLSYRENLPQEYYDHPENFMVLEDAFVVPKSEYYFIGAKYFQKQAKEAKLGFGDKKSLLTARSNLSEKSRLGYGAKNAHEFLAVSVEFYIRGKERFIQSYTPFLGQENAYKLYEGVKNEIFRGREY